MEKRWRLTAAGGDPRESATENKPPGAGVTRETGSGDALRPGKGEKVR